jgi:hypothetical protein
MVDVSKIIQQSYYSELKLPKQVFKMKYKLWFYNSEITGVDRDIFFDKIIQFIKVTNEQVFVIKSVYSLDSVNENIYMQYFNVNNTIEEIDKKLIFEGSNIYFEFFTFSNIVFITTEHNNLNIVYDRDTEWLIFQPAQQYESLFKSLYLDDETFENFRHRSNRNIYENNVAFKHAFQHNQEYIAELKSNYFISDKYEK